MRHLLLNLRHVPDDESAEIRAVLEQNQIAFYETEPNRWGISAGAIWIKEDAEMVRAKELMATYQAERMKLARADAEKARQEGLVDSFWSQIRHQPLRLLVVLLGAAFLAALSLWPLLLAGR